MSLCTPAVTTIILANPEELDIPPLDFPKPFFEDNVNSGIYPYDAYRPPFSHLKRPSNMDPQHLATHLRRLVAPTAMGLDVHQMVNERERVIEARIPQRICELEDMPAALGDGRC